MGGRGNGKGRGPPPARASTVNKGRKFIRKEKKTLSLTVSLVGKPSVEKAQKHKKKRNFPENISFRNLG